MPTKTSATIQWFSATMSLHFRTLYQEFTTPFTHWQPDGLLALATLSVPRAPPRTQYFSNAQIVQFFPPFDYQVYLASEESAAEIGAYKILTLPSMLCCKLVDFAKPCWSPSYPKGIS
ncbi:hypothetical protein EDD16DRAFT_1073612 [Pisolithus croceorrhizus]|nr:hypothetical protein EDD16DRAFT_1073612 [Pisolithus croceorrhizus]